jgi:hypothetical protein
MSTNEPIDEIHDRLRKLASERAEYEVNYERYPPQDLQLSLLSIRRQELAAMRELQEADPSFNPRAVAEGIEHIEEEIERLKRASGRA